MMLSKIQALFILFLSFNLAFSEPTEIYNLAEVTLKKGINEFFYQFSEPQLVEGKDPYFYFYFSDEYDVTLEIKDENKTTSKISFRKYTYFMGYNITNTNPQKYTFEVTCNYHWGTQKMIFIDSSRDININIEKLLTFSFKTNSIYNRPPMPLTFSLNSVKDKTIFSLMSNYDDDILEGEYLLEYCEIGENNICEFSGPSSNLFTLEKGSNYKIRLNCYKGSYYEFKSYEINYIIKEIFFGAQFFETTYSTANYYFIIDVKKYNTSYLYADFNNGFKTAFFSEEEKKTYIENIEHFSYSNNDQKKVITLENENDYLIINFHYNSENYKGYFYIAQTYYSLTKTESIKFEKDSYALLRFDYFNNRNYFTILSSNNNIKELDNKFTLDNLDNLISRDSYFYSDVLICAYGTKEGFTLNIYIYSNRLCDNGFDLLNDYKLDNSYFNQYNSDHIYMRTSTLNIGYGFNTKYFFNIGESYYLYIKKYYGNIDIYRYNQELNFSTDVTDFCTPKEILNDTNEFNIVNNELVTISGYQLFTLFNYDMSIYDFYIQKIEDSPYIQLNSKILQFNNTVKLLTENKTYYVDFKLDHLIKLDNNFDAIVTFTDKDGNEYVLDKNNRIIRDLKGEKFTVKTDKKALLYFYKKIPDNYEIGTIIFDKSQKGKNMKFNMKNIKGNPINIYLVKDFCFEGYFPMLRNKNWENIYTNTENNTIIYIDNLYDKLEAELLENEKEKYIIYIFENIDENNYPIFNSEEFEIGELSYFDNLLSENKYTFSVIPGNSTGSIFLNTLNLQNIQLQFILCKNKEINVKIENSNGFNDYYQNQYPYKTTINSDQALRYFNFLKTNSIISFLSNKEFLFTYSYYALGYYYDFYNFAIDSILQKRKNIVEIKFPSAKSETGLVKYFIIIIKKDEIKDIESDLDICFLTKLVTQNEANNSIFIKELIAQSGSQNTKVLYNFDISSLNIEQNTNLICSILTYDITQNMIFNYYTPFEFKLKDIAPVEISLFNDEEINANLEKNNFFKFNYQQEGANPKNIFLIIDINLLNNDFFLYLMDDTNEELLAINRISQISVYTNFTISKSGTYYLKFKPSRTDNNDFTFHLFIPGELIDTIDFSKSKYSKNTILRLSYKLQPSRYKVVNLKKDIIAYFIFDIGTNDINNANPFTICNDNTNECTENIIFYNFAKEYNYTIYINFVNPDGRYYYFPSYSFYSIPNNYIEHIKKGYYTITEPKMFIIDLKNQGNLILYFSGIFSSYAAYTNETISLENMNTLQLENVFQSFVFSEELGHKYGIIISSPSVHNDVINMVIANTIYSDSKVNEYKIKANTNAVGFFFEYFYERDEMPLNFYNVLTTISSPINSLKYITSTQSNENYNFILQNYFPIPIYFDEYKEDYNITVNTFLPRYSFTVGSHNDFLKIFTRYLTTYSPSYAFNLEEYLPLNLRINSDFNTFYEFLNLYLYEVKDKINIYIRKYYGSSELFKCNADFVDKKDLSSITKPVSICKNKSSLFERIYKLEGTDFISGYLGYNSYFDIYIEFDNDDRNIKLSTLTTSYEVSNSAKYLQKDIEYNINFKVEHLIKITPEFKAEVTIYNNEGLYIILNSSNPTSKVKGDNVKIKSNNNTMVYFYSKLLNGIKQFKIENNKGKNIEIKVGPYTTYIIDFGFEGYNPSDILSLDTYNYLENQGSIFIENIYDKLKTKLVDGEYLYIYYISSNYFNDFGINYNSSNINNPNNEYSFNLINKNYKNNNEEKSLVINNKNKAQIQYQVYFCSSPHSIEMLYQNLSYNTTLEFNEQKTIVKHDIGKSPIKLQFNSEEDFIFSYSFIDEADISINEYDDWNEERTVLNNLIIKEVNNNRNYITIKFYPNYKFSSTRYIIVITPLNNNDDITNLSNPCYIIKQVTEKNKNIQIINYVDIGEDDFISLKVSISDMLPSENNEYLINIISQELRFEKKLNFYEPYNFTLINTDTADIEIYLDEMQSFNLSDDEISYKLLYTKRYKKNELFLLDYKFYNLDYNRMSEISIQIIGPNDYEELLSINKEEGFIYFLCSNGGTYYIIFKKNKNNLLKDDNNVIKGEFRIESTEFVFELDISKKNLEFNEFNISGNELINLTFKYENIDKDYIKKIIINNIDIDQINKVISINKDGKGYKDIKFPYYTFEKNSIYIVNINFIQKENNILTLEHINIIDFDVNNIQNFTLGDHIYNDKQDKFLIIDWKYYENKNISIIVKKNNPTFLLANINEYQSINLVKEFKNIEFKKLKSMYFFNIYKDNYSVLMIQTHEKEAEVTFEIINENNKTKEKDTKSKLLLYIILISIFGVILLIILILLIRCCLKKRSENINEVIEKTKTLPEEKLLQDM